MRVNRRSFVVLFSLSILTTTGCRTINQQPDPELRILTYNIHHGEGTDGRIDLPRIAGVIRSVTPDLVALQEVDKNTKRSGGVDQAAELAKLTGMHVVFGQAMDYQNGGYGQAILSRWPIKSARTIQLPGEPGREPRIALLAEIQTETTVPALTFASTHLDHQRNDLRIESAGKLIELARETEGDFVLSGDFNATPESEPMQRIFEEFRDTSASNPAPTIPSDHPRHRIDYILARPPAWIAVETRVLNEPIASDHRPVFALLKRNGR